jgi:hypothetical protein
MQFILPFRRVLTAVLAAAAIGASPSGVATADETIELTLEGRRIEGVAVAFDSKEVHLLGRDGRLWEFVPGAATDFKKTGLSFRPFSPSEFRGELLRELGQSYEVSGTGHYLVAHPSGQGHKWADRFEGLYRAFVRYFSVRGLKPPEPQYPLVGIVCRDRNEFLRLSATSKGPVTTGVLGYYDLDTNRITLYDMGGGDAANWRRNAKVLIHEATHQTAFNTGIHSRYCPAPRWLAEGLAMLFETPAVYDSQAGSQRADRVNAEWLRVFRRIRPQHRPEWIATIVASDDLFRTNPDAAYAESWALTFYLSETMPAKYGVILRRTAARPGFEKYTSAQRIADFTAVFGTDWRMFEARFLRFIDEL